MKKVHFEFDKKIADGEFLFLQQDQKGAFCGIKSTDSKGGNFISTSDIKKVTCYFCKKSNTYKKIISKNL